MRRVLILDDPTPARLGRMNIVPPPGAYIARASRKAPWELHPLTDDFSAPRKERAPIVNDPPAAAAQIIAWLARPIDKKRRDEMMIACVAHAIAEDVDSGQLDWSDAPRLFRDAGGMRSETRTAIYEHARRDAVSALRDLNYVMQRLLLQHVDENGGWKYVGERKIKELGAALDSKNPSQAEQRRINARLPVVHLAHAVGHAGGVEALQGMGANDLKELILRAEHARRSFGITGHRKLQPWATIQFLLVEPR